MINVLVLEKNVARVIVYSAMVLFFIIVLPDTIALRNILLFLGCGFSFLIIKKNGHLFFRERYRLILLALPVLIFLWVMLHYCFFSLNPMSEWLEIKSLWLRSLLAFFFGVGLAISISKYREFRNITYLSFFFVPLINISAYLHFLIKSNDLIIPGSFIRYLFTKIEVTYFGSLASAVLFARFYEFSRPGSKKKTMHGTLLWIVGFAVVLASNIITDSRSGALIWILVSGVILFYSLWLTLFKSEGSRKSNLVVAIALVTLLLFWLNVNNKVSQRTWNTGFIADVRAGLDIHGNPQWVSGEGAVPLPMNSEGSPVNSSTYHRVAWAVAGMHLIAEHPFGYGVIKNSFTGLLDASGISHGGLGQTHSGWVDFGLAFGLPGILLLLTWILAIVYIATKDMDGLNILAASISIVYIPLMLVAETAWKEYLEAEFFMLAFASGLVLMRRYRN